MPAKHRNPSIYQLKVTLKGVKPPIWRRIQLRADTKLDELHDVLQIAMGWMDAHLHQFVARGVFYGIPDPDFEFDFEVIDERHVSLDQLLGGVKAKIIYEYDFGDSWEHEILLEKILEPEPNVRYPRCIKGKRSCPPEDVGGIWGYSEFLDALQNKYHPEHENYMEWVDGVFDPEEFDCDAVNQALHADK